MFTEDANPWKTLSSRIAYENRWIRVREDEVLRPDGAPGIYGVVEVPASVGIVALNEKDCIALVGQWRYSLSRFLWEIPRGGSEGHPDLLAVAQRELAEEAGVLADTWQSLGAVEVCSGITTDVQHLFLATGLTQTAQLHGGDERIFTKWVPLEEALDSVMSGELSEVCSVAALLKVARKRGM